MKKILLSMRPEGWHDENITTDVLLKICIALDCEISDILEIEKQKEKE